MCKLCGNPDHVAEWLATDSAAADGGTSDIIALATGGTPVGATGNQDVDGLLAGVKWNDTSVLFNFPSSATYYPADYGTVQAPDRSQVSFPAGFIAVSASFQNMVRKALTEFEFVTNLDCTELAPGDASNISVGRTTALGPDTPLGFRGYGFFPGSSARAGDIWFDDSTAEVGDTAIIGRGTWMLVLHELGHAMGLKHGHEAGGPGGAAMTPQHDHNDYSIMSYRRYEGGPTSGTVSETYGRPQSLMMYDILALQTMYGANYTTNSTDSVYMFSPTTGQMLINGVGGDIPGNGAADSNRIYRTIWDGGGNDTYDLSNYSSNLVVDLTPGGRSTFSTAQLAIVDTATSRTATGNVFNALQFQGDSRSLIENAAGGSGNDTIVGNQANNTLSGNGGNDTLDGGTNSDTTVYRGNRVDYLVLGTATNFTITDGIAARDGADTVLDVEFVSFADGTFSVADLLPDDVRSDFNGDGNSDILLRNSGDGSVYLWEMDGLSLIGNGFTGPPTGPAWQVNGIGDFNGDGKSDIVFENSSTHDVAWQCGRWTAPISSVAALSAGRRDPPGSSMPNRPPARVRAAAHR